MLHLVCLRKRQCGCSANGALFQQLLSAVLWKKTASEAEKNTASGAKTRADERQESLQVVFALPARVSWL